MSDEAWLEEVVGRLSRTLMDEELRHGEDAYPTELEMALRLALNAAVRAKKRAKEAIV